MATATAHPSATVRATHIARTLAAAFEAIRDLQKVSPADASALMESVASHCRSFAPQAMLAPQPPLASVKVPLDEHGAFYGVTSLATGVVLVVSEPGGHDAATPPMSLVKVEALCRDLMAVAAAACGEAGR